MTAAGIEPTTARYQVSGEEGRTLPHAWKACAVNRRENHSDPLAAAAHAAHNPTSGREPAIAADAGACFRGIVAPSRITHATPQRMTSLRYIPGFCVAVAIGCATARVTHPVPQPAIIPHSRWQSQPPLGYAADATRRNEPPGGTLAFHDLSI